MNAKAIEIINAIPSNDATPAVLLATVAALKALAAEGAGSVDTMAASGATDPAATKEVEKTLAQQAKPAVNALPGALVFVEPGNSKHVPAVATMKSGTVVNLIYSSDDGVTFTTMANSITLAPSQAAATPGQAYLPGT